MIPRWAELSLTEREAFRIAVSFLDGRLEERECIEWALRLKPHQVAERHAVAELLEGHSARNMKAHWRQAWRLIEESWRHRINKNRNSIRVFSLKTSLGLGDFSGAVLGQIADLVRPVLSASAFGRMDLAFRKLPKRPKKVSDILSITMSSGELVPPTELGLDKVQDVSFLIELGNELNSAIQRCFDAARRLGWNINRDLWRLGSLHRVYFVSQAERDVEDHEPDEFHEGIAPSVKLLYSIVANLVVLDPKAGKQFYDAWRGNGTVIYDRLWAAVARDQQVASAAEVATFLLNRDDRQFWDISSCPEVAELRALRFKDMTPQDQLRVTERLCRLPPKNYWRKGVDRAAREEARAHWAARELKRIEIGGGVLSDRAREWLKAKLDVFEYLRIMARVDEGFPSTATARLRMPVPDRTYDLLAGISRLDALEAALGSERRAWDDDPEQRAYDWIRISANSELVLRDLEQAQDSGAAYPKIWEGFGWADAVVADSSEDEEVVKRKQEHAARVCKLISELPLETARQAIDGITYWLSGWKRCINDRENLLRLSIRLWPIAAEVTNHAASEKVLESSGGAAQTTTEPEAQKLDASNTPASRLVETFLSCCPQIEEGDRPFEKDIALRKLRDAMVATEGRSGLIARYRLIEALPWFLQADPDWTSNHLIVPLTNHTSDGLALWKAVARRTHFGEVLRVLGKEMARHATNALLDRQTRQSLAWSIVIESLHAFLDKREPALPHAGIQQMIRSLSEEVRANAAEAVQRFVRDLSAKRTTGRIPVETLFEKAGRPFLQIVWPQERTMVTSGVARAFADLPATCGSAFVDAVNAIERFLMPFECWSMVEYGLYGEEEGKAKLSKIDDQKKAEAFLRLIDSTVGFGDGSVIPIDLAAALEQIQKMAPFLEVDPRFRRLAALSRRL